MPSLGGVGWDIGTPYEILIHYRVDFIKFAQITKRRQGQLRFDTDGEIVQSVLIFIYEY